jgi:CRP-like cAMP-binding protein
VALSGALQLRHYRFGDRLQAAGQPCAAFAVLQKGEVRLVRRGGGEPEEGGREGEGEGALVRRAAVPDPRTDIELCLLPPGEFVGEEALLRAMQQAANPDADTASQPALAAWDVVAAADRVTVLQLPPTAVKGLLLRLGQVCCSAVRVPPHCCCAWGR